jgi:hypothetical protein
MPRGQYDRTRRTETAEPQETGAVLQGPTRADETRRERRRRDDGDLDRMLSLNLSVPREIEEQLRQEGKVSRWILDTRMAQAHADDWDIVPGVEPVQANPMLGSPERLVLCSKYADWHDADRSREENFLTERENELIAGRVTDAGRTSEGLRVPDGQTNRITTQRGL